MQDQDQTVYLGIDIGGTNNKIAILSIEKLDIQSSQTHKVSMNGKEWQVYLYSNNSYESFEEYLKTLKSKVKANVKVAATGGGAVLQRKSLASIFGPEIGQISQFQAHAKGLQFYNRAELPLTMESFIQDSQCDIKTNQKEGTLKECKSLLFMSLGSGVNFQLYGQGEKGFERQRAKEAKLTAGGDGFFLQGTSCGGGFLMGLGRLSTGKTNYTQLLQQMQEVGELKQYYQAVLISLFQSSINLSILHQQQYILLSGALLSYRVDIKALFIKALQFIQKPYPLSIVILQLQQFQGFLGALGALQNMIQ